MHTDVESWKIEPGMRKYFEISIEMTDSKELLTRITDASMESEESQSMPGDAVPGPLAFFALRQQHGIEARRCHRTDGIAHATGLLRRSGCLPAEPYPPQQHTEATRYGFVRQVASRTQPPCYWLKATNAGVWGRAPRHE